LALFTVILFEFGDFPMMRQLLLGVKSRAEGTAEPPASAYPVSAGRRSGHEASRTMRDPRGGRWDGLGAGGGSAVGVGWVKVMSLWSGKYLDKGPPRYPPLFRGPVIIPLTLPQLLFRPRKENA
jgi:hypothetical protein